MCCPYCGSEVKYRDRRIRKIKSLTGQVSRFRLRRLRCQGCARIHTEIPDIIQPYKRYDSHAIQCVLDGNEEAKACTADITTTQRWKKTYAQSEPDIVQRLASIYARMSNGKAPLLSATQIYANIRARQEQWLSFVMGLLINSGHKLCTQFAFCPNANPGIIPSTGPKGQNGGRRNDQTIENSS